MNFNITTSFRQVSPGTEAQTTVNGNVNKKPIVDANLTLLTFNLFFNMLKHYIAIPCPKSRKADSIMEF